MVDRRLIAKGAAAVGLLAYTVSALAISGERALPLALFELFAVCYALCWNSERLRACWARATARRSPVPFGLRSQQVSRHACTAALCRHASLLAVAAAHIVLLVVLGARSREAVAALFGLALIVLIGWLLSRKRGAVRWRTVATGFLIQYWIAVLLLRTSVGLSTISWLECQVASLLGHAREGAIFVFGPEILAMRTFAFDVLPVIIFFSSFCSVLAQLGILQLGLEHLGGALALLLNVTPAEGVITCANVFLSMTESPMLIRPLLPHLSRAQLFSLMTCGFASVAGGVLAAFIRMGIDSAHLLTACAMSAPAALAVAKLIMPDGVADDLPATAAGSLERGGSQRGGSQRGG